MATNLKQNILSRLPKPTANFWKKLLLSLLLLGGTALGIIKTYQFVDSVKQSWDEIIFAYEKPHLVNSIRKQYESGTKQLEQELSKPEASPEDEIIKEILEQFEQGKD